MIVLRMSAPIDRRLKVADVRTNYRPAEQGLSA
jgi:hypothetical protein